MIGGCDCDTVCRSWLHGPVETDLRHLDSLAEYVDVDRENPTSQWRSR